MYPRNSRDVQPTNKACLTHSLNNVIVPTWPVTTCITAIPPWDVPRYSLLGLGLSVVMHVMPWGHGEAIVRRGSEV